MAIYKQAVDAYGVRTQVMMVIEEMSELTKEICKHFRGRPNIEAMADEIADVTIMLEQLRMLYGLNDMVCERMDFKVLRLAGRLAYGRDVKQEDRPPEVEG